MEKPKTYRRFFATYGGVSLAALYGLAMRWVIGAESGRGSLSDMSSFTFVGIIPFVTGCIPMMVANETLLKSWGYRAGTPTLSMGAFLFLCYWTGAEDIVCILVLTIPFLLGAAVGGLLGGFIVYKVRKRRGTLYALMVFPFISGWMGTTYEEPDAISEVCNSVVLAASPETVWPNVIRVAQIKDIEYNAGFWNFAGIPRPLYATLDKDGLGGKRTGHFTNGLMLEEVVTDWKANKRVAFNITVPAQGSDVSVFRKHVLGSRHMRFIDAAYSLEPVGADSTRLTLSSRYELQTDVNNYGQWWGRILLSDFQDRLLAVIATRCERAATVATQ